MDNASFDGLMARRGARLAGMAVVAALAMAAPAQGATVSYPAGGSSFSGGTQGWVGSAASCGQLAALPVLCTAENLHETTVGDPPGSIATRVNVTLNALTLFSGTGTWTSPQFEVEASGPVTGATFSYDRRVDSGGLVDLTPTSEIVVTLIDETSATSVPVLTETLTNDDAAFVAHGVGVDTGALVDGHTYRLRIVTTTTSSVAGVLGQANTRFDNVSLAVQAGGGDDGGGIPVISPGVKIVKKSVTNVEIANLMQRFGINADAGKGPGGSLIPLEECTVIGTPGSDRILGSSGNDVICGLGGNDVIIGAGGRDLIDGADGTDRLNGGRGGDLLLGLRGNDRLNGGAGSDGLGGGLGRDVLSGGGGADRLSGRSGNDRLSGNGGADRIAGGGGRDRLTGGGGRDRIAGGGSADRIFARDGARDRVFGGRGRDTASVDSATTSKKGSNRSDRVRGVERLR